MLVLAAALAVVFAVVLAARPAQARLIDAHASATAGGVTGWGTTPNTPDFFDSTRGGGVGFDLGLKLLFIDVDANFLQVLNGSGRSGTLTQFLLGTQIDFPLSAARFPDGEPVHVLEPKVAVGFGFGTPGPVHGQLTDDQISAKGVVTNASVGYEYFVNPFLAVGGQATFGWHYFFGGAAVNSAQGHSNGYHLIGLGTVTFHLGH